MAGRSHAALADWQLAARVAWSVASGPLAPKTSVDRGAVAALRADLDETVRRADTLARRAAGLGEHLPPARAHVVGRREWIRANLDSHAEFTEPVAEKLLRRRGMRNRMLTRQALALQIGAVFGYLSTRVLGQYEVFGPGWREGETGEGAGRLMLVGPNLLEIEAHLLPEAGVSPAEFRLGVCLHEIAHRLQFEAVPWTRPLLRGLLDAYLDDVDLDADRVKQVVARLPELLRDPSRLLEPRALLELILSDRQLEVIGQAQALMSLLEGHGNVVMDWGAEQARAEGDLTLDPSRVREVLNRRRGKAMNQVLQKAMGLSMKAEQYRSGERFILEVAERHGRDAFHRVWDEPGNVPTPEEIEDPDAWVARVGGATMIGGAGLP